MRLKVLPEDFRVREIITIKTKSEGRYAYFCLKKINRNTMDVIEEIAKKSGLNTKHIGYAGIKDKKAVTEQHISVPAKYASKIENIKLRNAQLTFEGFGDEMIYLGKLSFNQFEITARDLKHSLQQVDIMANYFGEQRFGAANRNAKAGKLLVKKEFKKLCSYLHIKYEGRDYIRAIKREGENMIKFYVHAYQSLLFNKCLAQYVAMHDSDAKEIKTSFGTLIFPSKSFAESSENIKMPLINFDTEIKNRKINEICSRILEEEGIKKEDFIIRQFPRTISQSEDRAAFVKVKNLKIGYLTYDELSGKNKQKVSFTLPKGSYATILLRQMALH